MNRLERWAVKHAGTLILVLFVLAIVVLGVVTYIAIDDAKQNKKLVGVTVVGPCREFGPDNPECRKQSRRIVRSCLSHSDCIRIVERLTSNTRRDNAGDAQTQQGDHVDSDPPGGGAPQSAPVEPQEPATADTPSPPNGGGASDPPNDGDTGPQGPPGPPGDDGDDAPPQPPQPEQPGLLDPVTQPVCDATGICL